jgi:hypothetical protein
MSKYSRSIVESQACPAAGQGNQGKTIKGKTIFNRFAPNSFAMAFALKAKI